MTTLPSAKLLVSVSGHFACIKIVGRANFNSSMEFKTLINELTDKQFTCFVLDLSECVLMDSTFLGLLAGFGLKMTSPTDGQQNGSSIELLNPNSRIADLLDNLGVSHLFKVVNGPAELPADCSCHTPAATSEPTREEVKSTCYEAHKTLMDIDPANVPRFKEVAKFLAEDLKKCKTGS